MAVAALDTAGITWREAIVGGGVATIGAAVGAGLAVAALCRRVAPPGTVDIGPRFGLPALPPSEVVLCSRLSDGRARGSLRNHLACLRATP